MSSNMDVYLQRNEAFAATDAKLQIPAMPFIPFKQVYVLTCVDPRVEPAAIIGAQLGEAIIARNIGGRVTDSVVRDLAWLCHLHENKTPDADWFEVAIIHHTDCGAALFTDPDLRRTYAARGGHDEETAASLAVLNPADTVAADVHLLRAARALAGSIDKFKVGGYAYDLKTGLLTTVAEPR